MTPGGDIGQIGPIARAPAAHPSSESAVSVRFPAPLAGNVFKVLVKAGDPVAAGQVVIILEAMKMETEVRATSAGVVRDVLVREGDAVKVGESLMMLS